ncbi:MAG: tRNA pseudouridine(13) synthase TruD [Myxococcaceae bacterium]
MSAPFQVPFVTQGVRASGGRFKQRPEDFQVEELPAYLPQGEGEHVFFWVQKRGLSTVEAAKRLARALALPPDAVSWAGMKDTVALTRQWLSARVAGRELPTLPAFGPELEVLEMKRHLNKLKGGHLKGNRFRIFIGQVSDFGAAKESFEVLARGGLPNFFGMQRFGRDAENASRGKLLLANPKMRAARFERKLWLSAWQSLAFNQVLSARVMDGTWRKPLLGDVLKKHESGGEFVCTEPLVDEKRAEAFELSPTGPMYGPQMRPSSGETAALEAKVLASEGVTMAQLAAERLTPGTRRLLRVPMSNASIEARDGGAWLQFELPSGAYATVVLNEIIKPGSNELELADEQPTEEEP